MQPDWSCMMEWAEKYNEILAEGGVEPELLEIYVDDGRQAGAVFRLGTRYDPTSKKMIISEDARMEDITLAEDNNVRMARVCLPLMNSINEDLVFTVEAPEDFPDNRLPTLDTKLTYFEKSMKTPFLLMKRSAMSQHQRCAILANELVRRLSNIDVDNVQHREVLIVIEQFTQQLKNSEYTCKEARGHVVDGIRGWQNKIERRKKENSDFYRLAKNTLVKRVKKKLLEKETWYRTEKKPVEDKPEDWELPDGWKHESRRGKKRKTECGSKDGKRRKVKGVMFLPHTHHSKLATEVREIETQFEKMTDYRLKMVEKAGVKVGTLLTDSDPWNGQNCTRDTCWLCDTKTLTGKNLRQDCSKRNLVYETFCMSCEERDSKKSEEETKDGEKESSTRLYKYIGETCRSVWERASEHQADLRNYNPTSHLLKHIIDKHEEEEVEKVKFGIRVVKYTQTPFERQILESVKIQQERQNHNLLNSRAEYNRCAIPRLSSKIGENDYKKWEKEGEREKEKGELLIEKIKKMKIERERNYKKKERQLTRTDSQAHPTKELRRDRN